MNESKKSMRISKEHDVYEAMEYTCTMARDLGYAYNDQVQLCLVTEESLVNALEYGDNETDNIVEISWNTNQRELEISVTQKGEPFSIEVSEEPNYGIRGRGIQLIVNIMDEVWLEENGDVITLHMKRSRNEKLN